MNDEVYINQMRLFFNSKKSSYFEYLKEAYSTYQYICIFGVGNMGKYLPEELGKRGIHIDFFCDNDKKKSGKTFRGIPCLSVQELIKIKDNTMVVIATRYYKEIYKQLSELGFQHIDRVFDNKFYIDDYLASQGELAEQQIEKTFKVLADERSKYVYGKIIEEWFRNEYSYGRLDDIYSQPQYFEEDLITMSDEEVFVDCGAYDGDTLEEYIRYSGGKFKKAILFELSKKNTEALKKNINQKFARWKDKIVVINKGVSNKKMEITYCEEDEGSKISLEGRERGYITTIDEEIGNEDVTYIKMDIEGMELAALQGAVGVINRCWPKLAICIYHKPQDIWEIPRYIYEKFPQYDIYIRHHTDLMNETVCYAIPKKRNSL